MRKKNKKVSLAQNPVLVLSRKAIAGWLVAVFFVCAWMFGIGVLVGRGTSPLKIDINELQKKLQVARTELMKKEQEHTAEKSDSVNDKPDLEFYETLKNNNEDVNISEIPLPSEIEKIIEPAFPKIPAKPKKESKKRLTRTQKAVTAPAAPPETEPAETSTAQPTAPTVEAPAVGNPFTVQVAAFKAAGDADKLVAELTQKGFSAYRAIGKIPGKGIWYRVRVGEFSTKAEADSTIAKLKKIGKKPMLVEK